MASAAAPRSRRRLLPVATLHRRTSWRKGRRLGGGRGAKEVTVAAAYDFEGLDTVEAIRRLLQIGAIDTLALDNSVNRNRALAYLAQSAMKLLAGGEHAELLQAIVGNARAEGSAGADRR